MASTPAFADGVDLVVSGQFGAHLTDDTRVVAGGALGVESGWQNLRLGAEFRYQWTSSSSFWVEQTRHALLVDVSVHPRHYVETNRGWVAFGPRVLLGGGQARHRGEVDAAEPALHVNASAACTIAIREATFRLAFGYDTLRSRDQRRSDGVAFEFSMLASF